MGNCRFLGGNACRVNCVAPGLIRTPMTETMTDAKQARDASLKVWPQERRCLPILLRCSCHLRIVYSRRCQHLLLYVCTDDSIGALWGA